MTITEILRQLTLEFKQCGIDTARLDAEVLISFTLGIERYRLITDASRELTERESELLHSVKSRRTLGEPVAYITGNKEFYSMNFSVNRHVLIPRPETELLVDLAVFHAPPGASILDLGTGSGAIAVALKHSRPDCEITATDISTEAIETARLNAKNLLGDGCISFLAGDLFSPVTGLKFDVILTNPPYIDYNDKPGLQRELFFEPHIALFCGSGGMEIIEKIIGNAAEFLSEKGLVFIETGAMMEKKVIELADKYGYTAVIMRDHAGLPRVASLSRLSGEISEV